MASKATPSYQIQFSDVVVKFSHSFVFNAQICYRCGAFEQASVNYLMTCYKYFICSLQGNHIFEHTWNMFTNVMRHNSCVMCIVYESVFH